MSGLDAEQLDDLEQMVGELLKKPWDQRKGRPRELTLREALIVTNGYMRQNITEEVWAEIFDVNQSTISRYITFLTPLIDQATAGFRPTAQQAAEATRDAIALVDGTLWPCWSWAGERELWAGKYKTTGHGSLIVTNLTGVSPSSPRDCQVVGWGGFPGQSWIRMGWLWRCGQAAVGACQPQSGKLKTSTERANWQISDKANLDPWPAQETQLLTKGCIKSS
jgi:hypothetical protein